MVQRIAPIPLGKGAFGVNAYLVTTDMGFVLVDTGMRTHRESLERTLRDEGCMPGSLSLILITHGDPDHIGNAAYLRDTFEAPIAMHQGDVGMTRDGDMFSGRKPGNRLVRGVLKVAFNLPEADRFTPDISLVEGMTLSAYGLGGVRALKTKGHSAGSMALLFEDGSLISGDLLENRSRPKPGSIMDDVEAAKRSIARLRELDPDVVYPGHGKPFLFSELEGVG